MKKIAGLCLLFAGIQINALAQCAADPNCPFASLICSSNNAPACQGVAFANVLTIAVPTSYTDPGSGTVYTITKAQITNITGFPAGITYQCNPSNCIINAGNRGCVLINGTSNAPGTYPTNTYVTVTILYGGFIPIGVPDTIPGTFVVQAKDCAGVCGGTATVDNCGICSGGTTGILPNCNDSNACTQDICNGQGGCTHTQICTVTISGKIQTAAAIPVAIPGVTVNLSGSQTQSMITGSGGLYAFTVNAGGSYTVTPSKANDATTNNGVTTVDISLIRRHVLGSTLLDSPYKIIAADGSGNGALSTTDIPSVRIVVLSSTAKFPPSNTRLWEFVSSYNTATNPFPFVKIRTYNNISVNQTNQNFIGVKIGDVNNSWNAGIP